MCRRSRVSVKKAYSESFTSETESLSASADDSNFGGEDSESEFTDVPDGVNISWKDEYTHEESGEVESLGGFISSFFVLSSSIVAAGLYSLINHERRVLVEVATLPSPVHEEITVTGQSDATICFSLVLAGIVVAQYFLFRRYDQLVKTRQVKLLKITERSQALVTSLFPEDVHKRLMVEVDEHQKFLNKSARKKGGPSKADRMQAFLEEGEQRNVHMAPDTKPIADFFPEATVMFGDLVGFTAWSSMREPTAVFKLLEAIYFEFDVIARRLGVFKVETIGDCYVAVAGLPVPIDDHALVMARFACDCREKLNSLVKELEKVLGPDTADLSIRTGLHSGPVTAGVLRGDRARFQLFGDTMNTTSRLESTGQPSKVHISQETAEYLIAAGKKHWLLPREDKVTAKGKGELTTYWLMHTNYDMTESNFNRSGSDLRLDRAHRRLSAPLGASRMSDKHVRLIDWITMELANLLKEIEISRLNRSCDVLIVEDDCLEDLEKQSLESSYVPREEVQETIVLPVFEDGIHNQSRENVDDYDLDDMVISELNDYVLSIAQAYIMNPFHNFEHASHVTMSVVKLLSRIVPKEGKYVDVDTDRKMHQQTYGISSDPLAQFAVVLAALVHDVAHPGVPNAQLVTENDPMSNEYDGKSPAEQNSINVAWRLLMEDRFANLRSSIYSTEADFRRFRQFIINTVMATDIMDRDLAKERKERWEKAFSATPEGIISNTGNRKATIVLEHIIQASDVAHTMQHWHVYRKWNGRLFEEMYTTYLEGRAAKDPSENWYEGELGFFDNYIIPLAKKLKDCGVFGVSSDEYLNYAEMNRKEWALNGRGVVSGIVETLRHKQREIDSWSSGPTMLPDADYMSPLPMAAPLSQPAGQRLKALKKQLQYTSLSAQSPSVEFPAVMSVLVVDDDKILRKLFTKSVMKIAPGWKIQDAGSGEEALKVVSEAETEFDLIFMDHYMGTDESKLLGSETVAELRKLGVKSKICGMSANDVEQMFDDSGANAFVFKPLRFRQGPLKSELERILGTNDEWGNVVLHQTDLDSSATGEIIVCQ